MDKISKSDMPIDRRPHHEIMQSFFNSPPCQHFLGGTRITLNNQGGEVIENDGSGALTIGWDDGSISTIKPIALNRRN